MRNRNTLEFLGTWEMLHNPAFKGVEFDTFLHEAGANRFKKEFEKYGLMDFSEIDEPMKFNSNHPSMKFTIIKCRKRI